jgi:hypothetical protein
VDKGCAVLDECVSNLRAEEPLHLNTAAPDHAMGAS